MRTLILFILLFTGIQSKAQENIFSYELNIGGSEIDDDMIFPGMSYLVGLTRITSSNKVFEAQLGLAAPTIFTGRIGTGIYIEDAWTTPFLRDSSIAFNTATDGGGGGGR